MSDTPAQLIEMRWKLLQDERPWQVKAVTGEYQNRVLQFRVGEWYEPTGFAEITSPVPQSGFRFRWKDWRDVSEASE